MGMCGCPIGNFPTISDVTCKENFGQVQKVIFVDLRYYGLGFAETQVIHQGGSIFWEAARVNRDSVITDFIPTVDCDGVIKTESKFVNITGANGIVSLLEVMTGGRWNSDDENTETLFGYPIMKISPFLQAPTQEPGEARTFGGGNDTPNGIEKFLGFGPSVFSAVMRGVPQSVVKEMKDLVCLSNINQLGVILVNGEGHMEMLDLGKDVLAVRLTNPSETLGTYPIYSPIPIRSLRISDKIHGGYEEPDYNEIQWEFIPGYSDKLVIIDNELYLRGPNGKSILDLKNEI